MWLLANDRHFCIETINNLMPGGNKKVAHT